MEPLSREERNTMKTNGRGVTDAEIDEYEELLVQRHWSRPDSEAPLIHPEARANDRIEQLYNKLYSRQLGAPPTTDPGT